MRIDSGRDVTASCIITGSTLLLAGIWTVAHDDGPRFVLGCASCSTGGTLLGWGLV